MDGFDFVYNIRPIVNIASMFSVRFQALYLLLQCAHNLDEALRRRKMQAVPPSGTCLSMLHAETRFTEEPCRKKYAIRSCHLTHQLIVGASVHSQTQNQRCGGVPIFCFEEICKT